MSDEAMVWLQYARENLRVAEMTFQAGLLNPCLQNAQQAVEKALKAIWICKTMPVKRTHSVRELNRDLALAGLETGLTEEDCDLLDSIYVSSKYPIESVLPSSPPDFVVCKRCTELARQVLAVAENAMKA
jgi:HEPN domain-containing protein